MRKIRGKALYTVKNAMTGHVHSSGSTKAKAAAQIRLLQGMELSGTVAKLRRSKL